MALALQSDKLAHEVQNDVRVSPVVGQTNGSSITGIKAKIRRE
jgi:hypothetical protein